MFYLLRNGVWLAGLLLAPLAGRAQEMPTGWALPVEVGQGFNHPPGADALYLATLQVVPQVTVVPERLRAGLVLGGFYPGTQVGGLAGGRLTCKLLEGKKFALASTYHLNLQVEYLPVVQAGDGPRRQWVGAGLGLGTSNLLGVAIRLHRDFATPATYGQLSLAVNLLYKTHRNPDL